MDLCQKVSVTDEYRVLSSSSNSIDDLFAAQTTECDVSLEWLSTFLEDCYKLPPLPPPLNQPATASTISASIPEPISETLEQFHKPAQENPDSSYVSPGRRTKRKRGRITKNPLAIWSHNLNPNGCLASCFTDPPLLQQEHWLADSELIVPKRQNDQNTLRDLDDPYEEDGQKVRKLSEDEEQKKSERDDELEESTVSRAVNDQNAPGGVQMRRCSHCMAHRTPQWRAGPMGPKTLCNACGVRYKSGRLLPQYRPAKSPTFVSCLHSNSHKKVLEMRMGIESSVSSTEE